MKWNRSINENWIKDQTLDYLRDRDRKRLEKLKAKRSKKRFRMVKVCDCPLTYKEIQL